MPKKNFMSSNSSHIKTVCNSVFQAYESVLDAIEGRSSDPKPGVKASEIERALSASPEIVERAGKLLNELISHTENGEKGYAAGGLQDWLRPLHVANQIFYEKLDLSEILSAQMLQILELEQATSAGRGRYIYRATLIHLLFKGQDAFACGGIDELEADRLAGEYVRLCEHVVELYKKGDNASIPSADSRGKEL